MVEEKLLPDSMFERELFVGKFLEEKIISVNMVPGFGTHNHSRGQFVPFDGQYPRTYRQSWYVEHPVL